MNPLIRPLGIASSLITSCQALAWSVLALLGILVYAGAFSPASLDQNVMSSWMYWFFLTDDTKLLMKGNTMIIFTSLYLCFSLIWMVISLSKFWVVYRQKWAFAKLTIIAWCACTAIISVLDIVTLSFLAYDYSTIWERHTGLDGLPYIAVAAAGVMMTIAARGFLLLIVNIAFTIMFVVWGMQFEQENNEPQRDFINAYQQNQPSWLAANENSGSVLKPYTNQGFAPENNQRPNSLERNRMTASPPVQSNNFAGIGRNKSRSPPSQHSNFRQPQRGPYIPEPDYSPTSLRKHPKSVLKSRNNY